jgi:hypothetical protein
MCALGPKDIESAFRQASKGHAEAVLALGAPVLLPQRKQIADLAVKNRLPAMYGQPEYVEDGGLMSYGVSIVDLYRCAATVCGQDFEREKARRSAGGAADEVRVHHQSQSGQADRPDDSTVSAVPGGQGD